MISAKVLTAVLDQVEYAVKKHGEWKTPLDPDGPTPWNNLAILTEEVGEVARALNDADEEYDDNENLKEELAQVAAVAMMWLQGIEEQDQDAEDSANIFKDIVAEMLDSGWEQLGTLGGTPVMTFTVMDEATEPDEPTEAQRAFTEPPAFPLGEPLPAETRVKLPDWFSLTEAEDQEDYFEALDNDPACFCDDYGTCPNCLMEKPGYCNICHGPCLYGCPVE